MLELMVDWTLNAIFWAHFTSQKNKQTAPHPPKKTPKQKLVPANLEVLAQYLLWHEKSSDPDENKYAPFHHQTEISSASNTTMISFSAEQVLPGIFALKKQSQQNSATRQQQQKYRPFMWNEQDRRPWISATDRKLKNQLTQQVVAALWKPSYCACALQSPAMIPNFLLRPLGDCTHAYSFLFRVLPGSVRAWQDAWELDTHKRWAPHK